MKTITITDEQAAAVAPLIRRHLSATFDFSAPLAMTLRATLAILDEPTEIPARSPQPAMSREDGIEACAIYAWPTLGGFGNMTHYDTSHPESQREVRRDAAHVLNGNLHGPDYWTAGTWPRFCAAVIAHARRLVATGQCPALADCKALRNA